MATKPRPYIDFKLYLTCLADGKSACQVALLPTPEVGETITPVTVPFEEKPSLDALQWLAAKQVTFGSMVTLGKKLANCLLPEGVIRERFRAAYDRAGIHGGVRLRLIIADYALKAWPWEYAFLDLVGGPESESMLGFLALNPRISIMRHEPLPYPHPEREKTTEDVTDIHMAFASALSKKQPKLQLEKDLEDIKDALKDFNVEGVRFKLDPVLTDATPDDLAQRLTKGTDIFHFAGHGIPETEGSAVGPHGEAALLLVTEPSEDPSTQLTAGGRELTTVVFPNKVIELLIRSLERIDPEDGLRVRLCLDGALLDLPWEYLILPDIASLKSPGGFLALNSRISLVREPPQPGHQGPRHQKKQRLLFFGARQCNTKGKDIWEATEEKDRLFKALEPASAFLEMQAFLSNEKDCQTALMQSSSQNDIFHYSGHTDVKNGTGYLVASDVCPEVQINWLDANVLGPLLRRAGTTLAVFSACNSGNWAFVEPLLQAGVTVVIGAQGRVYVDVAINFCERLYSALAIGLSLDEAVTWARLHLLEPEVLQKSLQWQWGTFMVYMRTPEAVLFPKPRKPQVAKQQDAARQARQVTIINVTQNIGSIQGGVVYGVSAGSIGAQVCTGKADESGQETER